MPRRWLRRPKNASWRCGRARILFARPQFAEGCAGPCAGQFPADYESIRELPGVGDYTAAAIASIAFGLPHAAVDGNVRRVVARLRGMDSEIQAQADGLLDRSDPGRWNQAVMELGATICTPRDPLCDHCPLKRACCARRDGRQLELPAKRAKPEPIHLARTLLVIRRRERIALVASPLVSGFWELPEPFKSAALGPVLARFRHTITHRHYIFEVRHAAARWIPKRFRWFAPETLDEIAVSTITRKALRHLDSTAK